MLYMPTFAQTVLHLDSSVGFAATFAAGTLLIVVPPLAGAVSDRIGRVRVALPAALILTLASIPAFLWLIDDPSATRVVLVQAFLCTVAGVYLGALPALLSELFVLSVRTTGISLSYNIAVVTAGGFAPMLVALLVRSTGSHAAPGFYLAGAAGLSFVSVLCAVRWAGAR
jgi:MFS transporter, MHS family, proline/betaine transporter